MPARTVLRMDARPSRENLIHLGVMAGVLIVSILVLGVAASPLGSQLTGATEPGLARSDQAAKAPAADVTLSGTIGTRTATDGTTEYTLTRRRHRAQPRRRARVVPRTPTPSLHMSASRSRSPVSSARARRASSVERERHRAPRTRQAAMGRWLEGVGERHPAPGSQEKADRQAAKQATRDAKRAAKQERFGLDCWPPGHCKDASGKPATPNATPTP